MENNAYTAELANIRKRIAAGNITDDELLASMRKLENRITLDELEQLCGSGGYTSWDESGRITAHRADGSVVKVLRGPGDPPLTVE